jgi:hypothetical protein
MVSFQDFKAKDVSYFLVVRIAFTYPFRVFMFNFDPQPISKIRVEFSIRVESVASFNHLLWISTLQYLSFKYLHGREVIIHHIEVFVSFLSNNFCIDFRKVLGAFRCEFSHSFIAVKPAPTRTNFEAIEEIINSGIGNIERVRIGV